MNFLLMLTILLAPASVYTGKQMIPNEMSTPISPEPSASGNVLVVSEQVAAEEESEGVSISAERPIYGIITDIGVVEFQAYNSTDSVVTLGMTLIVVTDSLGNETTVTFMNGLYLMGDSLKGSFAPGIGGTTSYFTETYAPQYRPVTDEVIPNVDGHLTSFQLTEDLANALSSSRPGVNCVW